MWVVYDHPIDFPDWWVARRFDGPVPTDEVITAPSAPVLRSMLREAWPDLVRFSRSEGDDPKIAEVWL